MIPFGANDLESPFHENKFQWLLMKYFVRASLIVAVRMLFLHTKRLCMAAAYQFFKHDSYLVSKYLFQSMWTFYINYLRVLVKHFTLCSIYRSNQPLWKFTALQKLILIILQLTNQLVVLEPLSYCFKQTIGIDVKASFISCPVSLLITWYNTRWYKKIVLRKGYLVPRTFHGLKITNWKQINYNFGQNI